MVFYNKLFYLKQSNVVEPVNSWTSVGRFRSICRFGLCIVFLSKLHI